MNLDQLDAILTIAEKGSFRAAAHHLHKSQSALSAIVKSFETEFDILLFDRTKYRPELTPAGHAVLAVARSTIEAAQYAARVATELGRRKIEAVLRVSVDPLVSAHFLKLLATECAKPARHASLVLAYAISDDDHTALLEGDLDLALAYCSKKNAGVDRLFLQQLRIVGAVSKHLLTESQPITTSFLKKNTQVIAYRRQYNAPADELISQRVYRGSGPKVFVSDHFAKLRLIESGIGWGRISEKECTENGQLVMVPECVFPAITLNLYLLRARSRALGPIAQAIWKSLAAEVAEEGKQ